MNTVTLHQLWQSAWMERVGWTLLHFLWQGTLVAAALAVILAALHRRPARTRYLASICAAGVTGILPLLTFFVLPLPVQNGLSAAAAVRKAETPPVLNAPLAPPLMAATSPGQPAIPARLPRIPMASGQTPVAPPAGFAVQARRAYETLAAKAKPLLPWCALAWSLGVGLLSLRLLVGWTHARRLCRQGTRPADGLWQSRLEILMRRMRIRQTVRLLESTLAEVPAVIGFLRPVILLPVGALTGLSTAQIEMILAHELAHIGRQDYLLNLGLALLETLGFYHPAVWWIAARTRQERECACDDLAVLACGDDRLNYVRALATLEEMRGPAGNVALAAKSGGRGMLLTRVRRLLGVTPERRPRLGGGTWWLAGAISLSITFFLISGGMQGPARAQESEKKPSLEVAVPAGQATALPAPLDPGLILRIQTVDGSTGQPAPGAKFHIRENTGPASIGTKPGSERETDAEGFAQWDHLVPGTVILDMDEDETYARFWSIDERYSQHMNAPSRLHPIGNEAEDRSLFIKVAPGSGESPVIVQTERGVQVSGRVFNPDGKPPEHARVRAIISYPDTQSANPGEEIVYGLNGFQAAVAADGTFTGCAPATNGGMMRLIAENENESEDDTLGNGLSEPFSSVPGDKHEATIHLTTGGWIEGIVVDKEGKPLTDIDVTASVLDHHDGYENHVGFKTNERGNFRIGPLRPAAYEVRTRAGGYEFGKEPPEETRRVVVKAGERAQTGPLHFDPAGWTAPPSPAAVPATAKPVSLAKILGYDPARWQGTVFPYDSNDGFNPADSSAPAETDPLAFSLGARIHGIVRRKDGGSVPRGTVVELSFRAVDASSYSKSQNVLDDVLEYNFARLPPGQRVSVIVDAPGFRTWQSPEFTLLNAVAQFTTELEAAVSATVRGRITDEDGRPAADAKVSATLITPTDGHCYLSLSRDAKSTLLTDAQGRFETRRLRVGDTFILQAEGVSDLPGSIQTSGAGIGLIPRLQDFTHRLTIADADGLEVPPMTLKLTPGFRQKLPSAPDKPFTPGAPFSEADRETAFKTLDAIGDVGSSIGASVLLAASRTLGGQPPNPDEQASIARFLRSSEPGVVASAVRALMRVDDPAIMADLKLVLRKLAAWPEDALALAARLHLAGDDDGFDQVAAWIRDPIMPPDKRRVLVFRALPYAPRRFAPLYIELLADADPAVRVNALGRLQALKGGEDFGFDPAKDPAAQEEGLARWRAWLASVRAALPVEYPPAPESAEPSAGWLGLLVTHLPDGSGIRVMRVVRDGPAQGAGVVPTKDTIIAVDGHPTAGKTAAEVSARELAGPVGVPVKLTIKREGHAEALEITVVRGPRPSPDALQAVLGGPPTITNQKEGESTVTGPEPSVAPVRVSPTPAIPLASPATR